jgi:2-amino-4-hydroxy-6-hydroxymethyldihydropteridine diphosphokinase
VGASSFYKTKPWGVRDQPDFVNAAVALETNLTPRDLLTELRKIETELGREPSARWGPRAIDLDILTYGDVAVSEPDLVIPHPRLYERGFALIPLSEIDPSFESAVDSLPDSERETVRLLEP